MRQAHQLLKKIVPDLQSTVFSLANSDELVIQLKSNPPPEKRKGIWESLKLKCFIRPIAAVYAVALLELVLVTKLGTIGRYLAGDGMAAELPGGFLLKKTQQSYVALARESLLGPGLEELVRRVEEAVYEVVGPMDLTKKVGSADMLVTLVHVRRKVEECGNAALRRILVNSCQEPEANLENWGDGDNIVALLAQEADILDNSDASTVLGEILDGAFEALEILFRSSLGENLVPMPKALPVVANLSSKVLAGDSPVVAAVEATPLITQFAAVVYLSGQPVE